MKTWLTQNTNHYFSLNNLPFGVFELKNKEKRCCTRIGNNVIDLKYFENKFFKNKLGFQTTSLNNFISKGNKHWSKTRKIIQIFFSDKKNETSEIKNYIYDLKNIKMSMPLDVGDYTDFYSSEYHATNVGIMFRGKENALLPNWKHMPIGYHGRSSSINISGENIKRPKGQIINPKTGNPIFSKSKLLDFELEMAFITSGGPKLGKPIDIKDTEKYIFGMTLFNDWSARDIQKWEYIPLGPFLGKSFASSISPWIITMEALEPFKIELKKQKNILDYLKKKKNYTYDIKLEVYIENKNFPPFKISKSNFKYLYWSIHQQLAHHTINGCNVNSGDMMASGTISGPTKSSYGSMLELSWKGTKPLKMPDGTERKFLKNGDTLIIKGICQKGKNKISFGEVKNKIVS